MINKHIENTNCNDIENDDIKDNYYLEGTDTNIDITY